MVLDRRPESNTAIKVENVKKRFRLYHEKHETLKETILARKRASYTDLWALNGVSYEFQKGKTYGIIGENGSGKSTLLKMITKILRPDSGTVTVDGRISALLELGAGFHPDLTGRENIYLNGAILRLSREEIDARYDDIVAFSEIEEFIDTSVKNYSSGMYMRLGFAIAVNVDPDILLIDEVLAVGDEAFQKKCIAKLKSIQAEGKTVVFVSHDAEAVHKLCDQAIFMDKGKIAASGDVDTVVDTYHAMLSSREAGAPRTDISGPEAGRYGTFEGRVESVELAGANKLAGEDGFSRGDNVVLRVKNRFDKTVKDPIFGIIISKSDGSHVYTTNTSWRNIPAGTVKAGAEIDVTYDFKTPLLSGDYFITVAIAHADASRFYDWWERAAAFKIGGAEPAAGTADLEARVTVTAGKDVSVG